MTGLRTSQLVGARAAPSTVESLLADGARRLSQAEVDQPWLESLLLACHVLGLDKATLLTQSERRVPADQARHFEALARRRAAAEPLAYIVGEREFYGRAFYADRRALVPRPETELLVEVALSVLRAAPASPLIVDVGTGSGCIAATLALELPGARVIAVDVSGEALDLARVNLERHELNKRVRLVQASLLGCLGAADLVVANLPYIPREAYAALPPDVREYEPRLALDGGPGGTRLLEPLIQQASRLPMGALLAELDPRHADDVLALARRAFPDRSVDVLADPAGRPRLLRVGGNA